MTEFDTLHPTGAGHRFIDRVYGRPEVRLAHPALPAYDPTFFYERVADGSAVRQVVPGTLSTPVLAAIRNATQAVNDAWILEHGIDLRHEGEAGAWVETKVYKDNTLFVADIQHKNQDEGVSGSLVAFDANGKTLAQFDNIADEYGDRWVPAAGLRGQLLRDLAESSADGSLGDHL
jgi:hypothetical protein